MNREACAGSTEFLIGAGIHDITGPAAGRQMIGYVNLFAQTTGGIHMRLRSRAFVIESPCNSKRIVFVSADLGMIFHEVKQAVVERLRERFGDELYTAQNVILSATHTHSGPGGYSHHLLYNAISLSFDPRNFQVIVDGIYESIVKAHQSLAKGTIRVAVGQLANASKNRSPKAYQLNHDMDGNDTDHDLTVLRLTASDAAKTEVGTISWFAVHGTSLSKNNKLISGDNKGFASYLFERAMGTDYAADRTFVAAFAQSNEGDVSPNVFGGKEGRGRDQFKSLEASAKLQYDVAHHVYDGASEMLTGGVDYRHVYVNFADTDVDAAWTHGAGPQSTCPSAIGVSKIAGAEDGRGPPIMSEGVSRSNFTLPRRIFVGVARWLVIKLVKLSLRLFSKRNPARGLVGMAMAASPRSTDCQAEKPIFLATGAMKPDPWTPSVLPVQLVTIGQLAVIAVPFECTTMAGRRIRAAVKDQLEAAGIRHYVIAGLANEYGAYVTTREEYARQDYEGASTEFGPWQLAAIQQTAAGLAVALRDDLKVDPGPDPVPPKLIFDLPDDLDPVNHDAAPGDRFGAVLKDAQRRYKQGEVVKVSFWAGHPARDFQIQSTFLQVQRQEGDLWLTVARDCDPETRFIWRKRRRFLISPSSEATIEWHTPPDQQPGTYRIVHNGHAKPASGQVAPYCGTSRTFAVGPKGRGL